MIDYSTKSTSLNLTKKTTAYLLPILILIMFIVSLSSPIALIILETRQLKIQGKQYADKIADLLSTHIISDPVLWKYNTLKIITHLSISTMHPDLKQIIITDNSGIPININGIKQSQKRSLVHLLWVSSSISNENTGFGKVWLGLSIDRIVKNSLLLFFPFFTIGMILCLIVYFIPARIIRKSEEEIIKLIQSLKESQNNLSALNKNLAEKVEEKTKEISSAYKELKQKEKRLRQVSQKTVAIQEEMQRKIARELHDSVGQILTAIRIQLQILSTLPKESVESQYIKIFKLLDNAIDEIRNTISLLRPTILDEMGLKKALEQYCMNFEQQTSIKVDLSFEISEKYSSTIETACYRIVQEGLTNIKKHSKATITRISIKKYEDNLFIEIQDNGKGMLEMGLTEFDKILNNSKQNKKFGLIGIKERVELLDGEMSIARGIGDGISINIRVSLSSSENNEGEEE